MKVRGLDGKIYVWNPIGNKNVSREVPSYHEKARLLLKKLYPSDSVLEEVGLPGTSPLLYADFYLPLRKLIVEAHGEQHYKQVDHFHANQKDFLKGKARDKNKADWCATNGLYYIELPYMENLNEWRERIITQGKN